MKDPSAFGKLRRGELTFGLREAVVVSLMGIAIASIAAYHYVGR